MCSSVVSKVSGWFAGPSPHLYNIMIPRFSKTHYCSNVWGQEDFIFLRKKLFSE